MSIHMLVFNYDGILLNQGILWKLITLTIDNIYSNIQHNKFADAI